MDNMRSLYELWNTKYNNDSWLEGYIKGYKDNISFGDITNLNKERIENRLFDPVEDKIYEMLGMENRPYVDENGKFVDINIKNENNKYINRIFKGANDEYTIS